MVKRKVKCGKVTSLLPYGWSHVELISIENRRDPKGSPIELGRVETFRGRIQKWWVDFMEHPSKIPGWWLGVPPWAPGKNATVPRRNISQFCTFTQLFPSFSSKKIPMFTTSRHSKNIKKQQIHPETFTKSTRITPSKRQVPRWRPWSARCSPQPGLQAQPLAVQLKTLWSSCENGCFSDGFSGVDVPLNPLISHDNTFLLRDFLGENIQKQLNTGTEVASIMMLYDELHFFVASTNFSLVNTCHTIPQPVDPRCRSNISSLSAPQKPLLHSTYTSTVSSGPSKR